MLGDLAVGAAPYLNQPSPLTQQLAAALLPGFLERYGYRVAPEHAEVCRRFVAVLDAWAADRRPPLGLVHGDYRLDNLLFTPDGGCKVVDWQTVSAGARRCSTPRTSSAAGSNRRTGAPTSVI